VDALAGDEGFLALRTRRPQRRPLEMLEQVLARTQTALSESEAAARDEADAKIQKLRSDFREGLDKIDQRTDLDENAKQQLRAQVERSSQRRLDADIEAINRQSNLKIREAKIVQQRSIEGVRDRVRSLALGLPGVILGCLALTVFVNRRRGERLIVPSSRQRSQS
jgi:ABC-2 type transport system permease protein